MLYEQEADRIADQVMGMTEAHAHEGAVPASHGPSSTLSRKCPSCEGVEKHADNEVGALPESVQHSADESFVNNLGPGRPLDAATRERFSSLVSDTTSVKFESIRMTVRRNQQAP